MADTTQRPGAAGPTLLADTALSGERSFVPLAKGTAVGRYLVLHLVGEGGMGAVYAAYDPDLDRRVALKLLKLDAEGAEAARARLLKEAQAMARLSHPGVVAVHDAGVFGEQLFVAMELVQGETLADWLAREPRRPRDVVGAFVQAGEGLAAAHAAGLVHRDFKPENVLVDRGGRVRVTDFGLAHVERSGEASVGRGRHPQPGPDVTLAGCVAGTPWYMSPEQFLGGATDARTDQFSFCLALFEALAGRRPFDGEDFAGLREGVLSTAPRLNLLPKGVPAHLRRALARGLERDPVARFPSMDELLAALRRRGGARLRRVAKWGLPALVAAGAVALVGAWEHRQQTHCGREAQAAVQARWSPERRGQVRAGLAGAGLGEEAVAAATAVLDAHARDWAAAQQEACEERRYGVAGGEALFCLQRRALQEEAVAHRLSAPSAQLKDHAGQLLQRLRPPAECLQRRVRPAAGSPGRLQAEVEDLNLVASMGLYGQVRERADALVGEARATGAFDVAAELLLLRGLAQHQSDQGEAAVATYREAVREADRAGADELSLYARVGLANVNANTLLRPQEAYEAVLDAEAWLGRLGSPARLELDVSSAFCNAESARGRREQSLARCAKAVELAERIYGAGSVNAAKARNDLAVELDLAGQRRRAAEEYRKALETLERDPFKRPILLVTMWGNLAIALANVGRSEEALGAIDRGWGYLERLRDQAGPFESWLGLVRAEAFEDRGNLDEAERAYAQAAAAYAGEEEMTRAEILAGQARLLVRRGRPAEALPLARRAAGLARKHPDIYSGLFCELALAQALWATGEDREGALKLGRALVERLRGPEDGFRRGQVEAWLEGKDAQAAPR